MPGKNNKCCCCDPCNTTRPTAVTGCCRCVPRRLCATFHADDPYCDCDGAAVLLAKDANDEYTGTLFCGSDGMDITVSLFTNEYGECFWRVESYDQGIDQLFAIDYGGESCESPTLSVEVSFYDCAGTVEIARHDHARLPKRLENGRMVPFCGDCDCVCQVLCLTRIRDNALVVDEFAWDESSTSWKWGYEEIVLSHDEYTGECLLTIPGFAPVAIGCPDTINVAVSNDDPYDPQSATARCRECQCTPTGVPCNSCDFYPDQLTVIVPELGIVDVATHATPGGGPTLEYLWEGGDAHNAWQCDFGCNGYNVNISANDGAFICHGTFNSTSDPPDVHFCDPIYVEYSVPCLEGGAITIILMAP